MLGRKTEGLIFVVFTVMPVVTPDSLSKKNKVSWTPRVLVQMNASQCRALLKVSGAVVHTFV